MADKRILIIGSSNMDLSINMYKIPASGQTVIDDGGVGYTPGGKGANSAITFARLGADAVFCTKLGADMHGQSLYNYYKEQGINTTYIKVDHDNSTGLAVVLKESSGDNRIIVYPGANNNLSTENILEAFRCMPDALYLGFEIPFSVALNAAKIAAAKGIPVFVDAAPASKEYTLEALPQLEIFSPNETETFEYTGIIPRGQDASLRAALELSRRVKSKYIVIKQGEYGSFVYDGRQFRMVPAYRPQKVVDTTGAGDTYTAAITLEYLRTADVFSSARYASAAAAIAISRKGASVAVPADSEVREFMAKNKI